MDRTQKQTFVKELNARVANAGLLVVSHYRGLSVKEMTDLRGQLRAEGAELQVTKNRLAKLALEGTPCSSAQEFFVGPTALAISEDAIAAAKITQQFADKNKKFVIVGGAMGEKKLTAEDVKALSKLPSLDELRGMLVGMIQTPATRIATLSAAPATKVARVIAMKPE